MALDLLFLNTKNHGAARIRRSPASPPMTPPTIAPTLDPDSSDGAGDDSEAGEAVVGSVGVLAEAVAEEVPSEAVGVGFSFWVVPSRIKTPRPSLQQSEPRAPSPQQ